jgi:hypothetical protein
MTDRESLRPVIAEILDGLATTYTRDLFMGGLEYRGRLERGADTLRWTHAYEETPTGDELLEFEHLREIVGDIEGWLDETKRDPRGYVKRMHPGTFLKNVSERLEAEL